MRTRTSEIRRFLDNGATDRPALASMIGVTSAAVGAWYRGDARPSTENWNKFVEVRRQIRNVPQLNTVSSKKCTHCNTTKEFSEFYKDRTNSTGFGSWCKACKIARDAKGTRRRTHRAKAPRILMHTAPQPAVRSGRAWVPFALVLLGYAAALFVQFVVVR